VRAARGVIQATRRLAGSISARRFMNVGAPILQSPDQGRGLTLIFLAASGTRVKQGQLLATLEIPEMIDDLNHSRASIRHSEAEVKRAQDEVKRAQSVHDGTHALYTRLAAVSEKKPGLIAQQDIDEAQSRDLAAEAQISVAISALAAARQQVEMDNSARDRVQTLMDYRRVTAPFTGVITKRFADSGSMIQAGTASTSQTLCGEIFVSGLDANRVFAEEVSRKNGISYKGISDAAMALLREYAWPGEPP